jgi:hypothetical protein
MEESVQGAVELRRENWGYLDVRVQSDAPFLIPERPYIGEEHFVGNLCHFSYEVREDLLHAGKNFGKLTFVTASGSKKLEFFVTASRGGREQTELGRLQHDIRNAQLQLTQLFLDYGLKKIVTGMWARQTIKLLDYLMPLGVHVPLYTLMKAQALLINRQKQEALWLMEDFKRSWGDHKTPIWGYYLYLCTLAEREPSYVERLTHEIEELCQRYPDDMLLFWVTLFVREDYCHVPSRRLRAIEQWTRSHDCISPCFYLEAYQAYARDPYLLGKLEDFEIRVLFWAVKHDAITADLAEQIIHLTAKERRYNRFLYQILQACYEVEHTDEVLQTIISYLIRGQRFHPDYHNWYEAGIDHELRITNLCEAYLLSLDDRKLVEVPKMIQLYFQYSSTIAWEKRAVLYVNIIADKDKKPKIYDKYQPIIEQFAIEQLKACNISDDLAVIYDELITAGQMKEETARLLSHVLFTHKLTCMDERIARAVIWDERLIKPQTRSFVRSI